MKKILITGSCGMIGTSLIIKLYQSYKKIEIIGLDNLSRSSSKNNLKFLLSYTKKNRFNFIFLKKDLVNFNLQNIKYNLSHVIHLADIVGGIHYVFNNKFNIFNTNILIDSKITRFVIEKKIPNYLYVGTACSFPKKLQKNQKSIMYEKDKFPADPESHYGWSKLIGEMQTNLLIENKINAANIILHNVYGKWCDFNSKTSQVIPSLILRASKLKNNEKLSVWGDGNQSRSFINSDDVASFITKIVFNKNYKKFNSIQIGNSKSIKIKDVALIILREMEKKNQIIFTNPHLSGDKGRAPDLSISKKIKFIPTISMQNGIADLIDWGKRNKIF